MELSPDPVPSPPAPAKRPAASWGASWRGAAAAAARPVVLLPWVGRRCQRERRQHLLEFQPPQRQVVSCALVAPPVVPLWAPQRRRIAMGPGSIGSSSTLVAMDLCSVGGRGGLQKRDTLTLTQQPGIAGAHLGP